MEIWVIDESEDFIVLNCCGYVYYKESTMPPLDFELEDGYELL